MLAPRFSLLAFVLLAGGLCRAQQVGESTAPSSARVQLVGAWHLVAMDEPAADGKLIHVTDRKGLLVYTRDGHVSVQLMYPPSEAAVNNAYVMSGYEASFGSYTIDEQAHTVTHHIEGSLTRGLVGQALPRVYQVSGKRLMIGSARTDEHWSVTWEHD